MWGGGGGGGGISFISDQTHADKQYNRISAIACMDSYSIVKHSARTLSCLGTVPFFNYENSVGSANHTHMYYTILCLAPPRYKYM